MRSRVEDMAQLCLQLLSVHNNMNDSLMDVYKAVVYLGSILRVHFAAFHKHYLKWERHVPHICLYLLRRESERRGRDLQ